MKLTIRHADTCLSCYVLDHCNGESEMLIGVPVDGKTRYGELASGLINELMMTADSKLPDAFKMPEISAAIADCFEGADMRRTFDKSLDVATGDDDGETCFAWFRLSWSA